MRKLLFRKLHSKIHRVENRLHREKSHLRTYWHIFQNKLQSPEAIFIYLTSSALIGFWLVHKKREVVNPKKEVVIVERKSHTLSTILTLATTLTPPLLELIQSHNTHKPQK